MISKQSRVKKVCYLAAGCAVILFITLFHLPQLKTIYVVPDEFGYWTAASFFCGYDWSSVATLNPYYSFGYGLLLAPLLLIQDPVLTYHMAIALNGVFLCLSFLIAVHCLGKLFTKLRLEWVALISLAVSLYASNVGLSQTTLCECLLVLLFWCAVLCFIHLCETGRTLWLILFLLTLLFSLLVHMRSIGLLIAGGMLLCVLLWKKVITWKQFVAGVVVTICLLGFSAWFKEYFQAAIYSGEPISDANDLSGQVRRLQDLLTWQGIKNLIKGVSGKCWYVASASLLLVPWLGVVCAKQIRPAKLFSRQERDLPGLILVFVVLCFLAELGISSIFMLQPTRIDTLIYGRYSEFVLGPMLGIALCWLLSLREFPWKEAFLLIAGYVLLSMLTHFFVIRLMYSDMLTNPVYGNIIGLFRYVWHREFSVFSVSMKSLAIIVVLHLLLAVRMKRERLDRILKGVCCGLAVCVIAGVWIWNGVGYIQDDVCAYQEDHTDTTIAEIINNIDGADDIPVYYVYNDQESTYIKNRIFTVQLALKDKSIALLDGQTIYSAELDPNAFYIVNKDSVLAEGIQSHFRTVFTGNKLELFVSYGNQNLEALYTIVADLEGQDE